MDLDAQGLLADLQALRSDEPASVLPRLRELTEALAQASETDRRSPSGMAAALTQQAMTYLCAGIETEQNVPEIKRRFAVAIRRAEGWAVASATARLDDPRLR
jgi:hypothetical protein